MATFIALWTELHHMNLAKIALVFGVIIALSFAYFYYLGEQKDAAVLQVQVVVKGDADSATIEDITARLEKVTKVSVPKGTLLITPGVTVTVIKDMAMIGEWTSVPYNGTGVYNLTVGLTKVPESGDILRVVARVMNAQSQNMDVRYKDIIL